MKQHEARTKANIFNLLSLWKAATAPFGALIETKEFDTCYLENSDWPRRLWFNDNVTEISLNAAKLDLKHLINSLTIPCWEPIDSASHRILKAGGFEARSKQIGMSIEVSEQSPRSTRLRIERVSKEEQSILWASIFERAFGNYISEQIIMAAQHTIEFYLAFYRSEPIGTVMLHQSDNTIGIHGLGIVPEMRKQGFAEDIMIFLLQRAKFLNGMLITLQASEMGRSLYNKMGFKEDFVLENYKLREGYEIAK